MEVVISQRYIKKTSNEFALFCLNSCDTMNIQLLVPIRYWGWGYYFILEQVTLKQISSTTPLLFVDSYIIVLFAFKCKWHVNSKDLSAE